jgi:hypothetical protein
VLKVVEGNLLDATETYLCHQTNCITQKAAHLSYDVFKRFPYANVYQNRTTPDHIGTIAIRGNGNDKRFVVNMFGQYWPGKSRWPGHHFDGKGYRWGAFQQCLIQLAMLPPGTFAMPYKIGCGAAGGDWNIYESLIKDFSQDYDVTIYRRKEDK